ncbi:MAG: hypothetical protein JXQ91_04605 [Vannielia sp.]|uniref:hypothetical protein n=1 Tax=Vannielia sp. TaxID=2813045 RepID=UPI003B8CA409
MKGMPQEGRFVQGRVDPVSGQRWVHVSRQMALGHPKGRLGLALYAVVLAFAALGAFRLALWSQLGGLWYLVEALLALLAGLALFFRLPPGAWLGLTVCALVLVDFAKGNMVVWSLAEAVVAVVIGFYLLTGERVNLIYRHRYLAEDEEDADV